jgi:hypothetical protein
MNILIKAAILLVSHTYYNNDGYTAKILPVSKRQRRPRIMCI